MTAVRPLTLDLRYAVYAKLYDPCGMSIYINSYTRPEVAKRACSALEGGPAKFIQKAWFADTHG